MYLTVIFILTIVIPFLTVPKHIKIGILPPYRVVLLSMLGVSVTAVIVLMFASFSGQGLYAQLIEAAKIVSEQAASNEVLKEAFGATEVSDSDMAATLLHLYSKGFLVMPAVIMFMGAVVSYIAYIILSNVIGKKSEVKKMPKFREFTFPHGTAMAVMIMYLVGWILLDAEAQMGEMLYANFSMIFDVVFVLQGIATVMMFFHFKKIPQPISVAVCAFMCITSIGKTFMVLLGMADLFIGLRAKMGSKPSGR